MRGKLVEFDRFIGNSKIMHNLCLDIEKLAESEAPIFIKGESGTGKEVCAHLIHHYSNRKQNPFIALNCAALPKNLTDSALFGHVKGAFTGAHTPRMGAIGKAEKGILFLDEIGDLDLEIQAKLLRFCDDFSYSKLGSDALLTSNVRILCATNKDIKNLVKTSQFREDLFYRLHVNDITVPPLRERGNDVLDIAYYYLTYYTQEQNKPFRGFSENAEKILRAYRWPGNIRELQNIVRRIVATQNATLVLASMLPNELTQSLQNAPKQAQETENNICLPLWKVEKHAIQNAIAFTQGNIPKAASMLDVAPSTLYRKIKLWENK